MTVQTCSFYLAAHFRHIPLPKPSDKPESVAMVSVFFQLCTLPIAKTAPLAA